MSKWAVYLFLNLLGLWQQIMNELLSNAQQGPSPGYSYANPFLQSKVRPNYLPYPWKEILNVWKKIGGSLRDPQSFEYLLAQPIWENEFFDWPILYKESLHHL